MLPLSPRGGGGWKTQSDQFLPRCMECRRDKTEESSVQIFIPYERSFSLVSWEEEWLVGATQGSPLCAFQWAYDEHRTLPLTLHMGSRNRKIDIFRVKSHFVWRKSATKFICAKTVGDAVVRHSLAYLSMYKWGRRGRPLLRENLANTDLPLSKRQFSTYFRSLHLSRNTLQKC